MCRCGVDSSKRFLKNWSCNTPSPGGLVKICTGQLWLWSHPKKRGECVKRLVDLATCDGCPSELAKMHVDAEGEITEAGLPRLWESGQGTGNKWTEPDVS